jgi:hypothetical protein
VNGSPLTEKKGWLSGAALKYIAIVLMIINHMGYVWFDRFADGPDWLEDLMWYVTRPSFFIFAFLIAEGLIHTRSRPKFLLRLALFAFISEPFFDFCFYGTFWSPGNQNVFITHFLAAAAVTVTEAFPECKKVLAPLTGVIAGLAAHLLSTDYSFFGVAVILCLYYLHDADEGLKYSVLVAVTLAGCPLMLILNNIDRLSAVFTNKYLGVMLDYTVTEAMGLLVIPLLTAYNGQRGRQMNKYVYYSIYPLHLLLFGLWGKFFGTK